MDGQDRTRVRRDASSHWLGIVVAAASAVVLLWFLEKIITAILLVFFALVVAIALSAPANWMVGKGLGRRPASVISIVSFFACLFFVGWLVIPEVAGQVVVLIESLPELVGRINDQLARMLERYPELQGVIRSDAGALAELAPPASKLFESFGSLSLSLLGGIALLVIFLSAVMYVVLDPIPILRGYLGTLRSEHRASGMRAYRTASRAVVGWTKASLIVGSIEFVAVFAFLTYMNIPAALVWAALAFFAEFVPRIGGYIMAIPPVIVSLTLGPATALWVALFYLAMNELLGNFLAPRIRGETMQLHPVLLLFFTLAFALAFAVLGAMVATPAAAFFSAFYNEFYIKRRRSAPHLPLAQADSSGASRA